jgi:hypothetical protein
MFSLAIEGAVPCFDRNCLISAKYGLLELTQYYKSIRESEGIISAENTKRPVVKSLSCDGNQITYQKLRQIIRRHEELNFLIDTVSRGQSFGTLASNIFDKKTILFLDAFHCQPQKLIIEYEEVDKLEYSLRELRLFICHLL